MVQYTERENNINLIETESIKDTGIIDKQQENQFEYVLVNR